MNHWLRSTAARGSVGLALILLGLAGAGCLDPGTGGDNSPPAFVSAEVSCTGDDTWLFLANLSDPDGPDDIAVVYADVYDDTVNDALAVGSVDLLEESPGVWSAEETADATNALGPCTRAADFTFELWAIDYAEARVSIAPAARPGAL